MPYPWGTPDEISMRAKCYKANTPIIFNANYNTSVFGGAPYNILYDSLPYGYFAPENYIIVKATLSFAVHAPFGGDTYGIIGWSFGQTALDWSLGTANLNNGDVIAAVVGAYYGDPAAFGGQMPAPSVTSQEFDFSQFPIYLEKGKELALMVSTQNSCNIVYSASLYLLPTFE